MPIHDAPDLVVGIDFGQTCTGVAYNFPAHGNENVRWIQKWPGRAQANENKVPTVLLYTSDPARPMIWGFHAESSTGQYRENFCEWFKTHIDPSRLSRHKLLDPSDETTYDDILRWYRDFFAVLYSHIKQKLASEMLGTDWVRARIEYLFSVPTTWSPHVVEVFRGIIMQTGFSDTPSGSHTVAISMTEPEAAAVYTSASAPGIFQDGEILVVCDAGGGTTDISALQVTSNSSKTVSLNQLRQVDVVNGDNIGSAAIDHSFEQLILERLQSAEGIAKSAEKFGEIAWQMTRSSHFQNTKCEHGALDDSPRFAIPVALSDPRFVSARAGIRDGEMHFDRMELQLLFDKQIEKLFKLIDRQINAFASKSPSIAADHLILSGGLGQSPYVQQRLQERYGHKSHTPTKSHGMQVHVAPEPQLAVCKGLVLDRLREIRAGQSVLGWRCCRASYGLVCKELYNVEDPNHIGCKTQRDLKDKKLYVQDCIDWFVIKGTPMAIGQPIVHNFVRKISSDDPQRTFPTKVVVSHKETKSLPYQLNPEVERLCDVESDLAGLDDSMFKERNKEFWKRGERYLEISYQVRLVIGSADLRFELWVNGQMISKDNSIKVQWAPSEAPSPTLPPRSTASALCEENGVVDRQGSGTKMHRIFRHKS